MNCHIYMLPSIFKLDARCAGQKGVFHHEPRYSSSLELRGIVGIKLEGGGGGASELPDHILY